MFNKVGNVQDTFVRPETLWALMKTRNVNVIVFKASQGASVREISSISSS